MDLRERRVDFLGPNPSFGSFGLGLLLGVLSGLSWTGKEEEEIEILEYDGEEDR